MPFGLAHAALCPALPERFDPTQLGWVEGLERFDQALGLLGTRSAINVLVDAAWA